MEVESKMVSQSASSPLDVISPILNLSRSLESEVEFTDEDELCEKPSTNTFEDWMDVTNETGENNMFPIDGKYGMWLIFRPSDQIDELYEVVAEATIAGELGYSTTVSTIKTVQNQGYENHVICVFTYDEDDFDDLMRVRKCLARHGLTEELRYKPCLATWEGRNYRDGDRNFIKYRA